VMEQLEVKIEEKSKRWRGMPTYHL